MRLEIWIKLLLTPVTKRLMHGLGKQIKEPIRNYWKKWVAKFHFNLVINFTLCFTDVVNLPSTIKLRENVAAVAVRHRHHLIWVLVSYLACIFKAYRLKPNARDCVEAAFFYLFWNWFQYFAFGHIGNKSVIIPNVLHDRIKVFLVVR